MKTILANDGRSILVDDDVFDELNRWTWRTLKHGYAIRSAYCSEMKRGATEYMHRRVMGLDRGNTSIVDHINGDKLDNRRENLRLCTTRQNAQNCNVYSHNQSGYKGVFLNKARSKWTAYIRVNGKQKYLGLFETPALAHVAYCKAATSHFGEFFHP